MRASVSARVEVEQVGHAVRVVVSGEGLTKTTAKAVACVWIDGRTARSLPPEVEGEDMDERSVHRWTTTADDWVWWNVVLAYENTIRSAADEIDAAAMNWRKLGGATAITLEEYSEIQRKHSLSTSDMVRAAELVGLRPLTRDEQAKAQGLALISKLDS